MKKYFVLIAYSPDTWNAASTEQQQAWHQDHVQFHREVGEHILSGEALDGASTATTLRHKDGRPTLTDGPFAETTETIGGYYLVEATDLDQAVAWCELLPDCYSLEIRPVVDIDVSA
ncbi:YciI family protein [Calidifontibacter indicus]|uniref:YCII-related domain-containing protein n=1 Tax=Calidifontibacter indicus TaxID=419650 RepID=A0A3D9UM80_9MICO|nr:YciI family protein [Calidifontibacter indicus]REF29090.1 hypothetical protein DFJ65_0017 [Calidifontibacter indicus]